MTEKVARFRFRVRVRASVRIKTRATNKVVKEKLREPSHTKKKVLDLQISQNFHKLLERWNHNFY